MSIRLTDKYVREKILREHTYQWSRSRDKGNNILKERDDRHRELNEEFGFMDRDGTFGIGCKSHTNLKYKNVYTWIDDKATTDFQKINIEFKNWEKNQKFSIYEYLFLQDFRSGYYETLDKALSKAKITDGLIFDSIVIHANHLLASKEKQQIKMYFEVLKSEIQHYEKFLQIKMWHLKEKKLVKDYYSELKEIVFSKLN